MATFIEEVASSLYGRYGDDISSLTLFLPSKRAGLFFAEALSRTIEHPVWEPECRSVDELMLSLTELRKGDRVRLIAELYKVYTNFHKESFDSFYHWGELLLSDFDMIDKYRVDAEQLFANINDIKELESDLSYLNKEQIALINRFWGTLKGETDSESPKAKFLTLWRSLSQIYTLYRQRLYELGIGYTGMIYRDAVERIERGEVEIDQTRRYVFIGFNALSACEQSLFMTLDNLGCAEFYWDRDDYYTSQGSSQEAGVFIRRNMGNLSSVDDVSHDNFRNIESVNVISTATAIAQCQYVVNILKDIARRRPDGRLGKETAVVLTDENLLLPLLYALPEEMKRRVEVDSRGREHEVANINVTMGYPLRSTLAYSFVDRLLELQRHARHTAEGDTFYHADVDGLLTHPYLAEASGEEFAELRQEIVRNRLYQVPQAMLTTTPLLQRLFCKRDGWCELMEYILEMVDAVASSDVVGNESATRAEFLSAIYDSVAKLKNVVESCQMEDLSEAVCRSLIRRHLQVERIPFTGEPLEGLQIMGILETRNLDFENVIILSMTDNNFPGNRSADQSFIPYGLRYGFSLPTAEHHEGVYAYYFYRLIERAKSVYMLYSTQSDDKSSAEPSRYIRQLEYETSLNINYANVGVQVQLAPSKRLEVAKSDWVMERMLRFTDRGSTPLSPTAFSRYLICPLRFYFASVEGLRVDDDLDEAVDGATFGNIFHDAAERLYAVAAGEDNPMERIRQAVDEGALDRVVDEALLSKYFQRKEGKLPELSGELQIIRDIVKSYLGKNVVGYDSRNHEFRVHNNESAVSKEVPIEVGGESYNVRFEGRADRIDVLNNGMMRVIDYKTGSEKLKMGSIDKLFHGKDAADHNTHIINTLLYAMMLSHEYKCDVRPELYYVVKMASESYSPLFEGVFGANEKSAKLMSYYECREEFEQNVRQTLTELYDRSIPFRQSEDEKACTYCDFKDICGRTSKR